MTRSSAILISVIILGAFGLFLIWPQWQKMQNTNLQLAAKKTELDNLEKSNLQLKQHSEELKKHSEEMAKIDFALPSYPDFPSFLHFLQEACSQNGVVLNSISPAMVPPSSPLEAGAAKGEDVEAERVEMLATGLGVAGAYPAFLNLLSALERSARLVEVDSISFSSPVEGDIFSFGLSVKAHSY